ncbi:MAG: hypothetical protein J6A24_04995 [Clostridia bacterium]|nr:hypothetical protein [Clostridia bacterium]
MNEEKKQEEKQEVKRDELDMETTIADMNVEGFSWYDPNRKSGKREKVSMSKKEQRAMIRGAYRAMLPMIGCILVVGILMILLAYLWLS